MPMQTFLTAYFVTGQSGKLRINKIIAAPTENLAQRKMQRLIADHSGYKVGAQIQVEVSTWESQFGLGAHNGCGDVDCCGGDMLHPDKVDEWIGTARQIYDTGRTMATAYNDWRIKVDKERDQARIELEQRLLDPEQVLEPGEAETILDEIQKVYA